MSILDSAEYPLDVYERQKPYDWAEYEVKPFDYEQMPEIFIDATKNDDVAFSLEQCNLDQQIKAETIRYHLLRARQSLTLGISACATAAVIGIMPQPPMPNPGESQMFFTSDNTSGVFIIGLWVFLAAMTATEYVVPKPRSIRNQTQLDNRGNARYNRYI